MNLTDAIRLIVALIEQRRRQQYKPDGPARFTLAELEAMPRDVAIVRLGERN